jgi:hypothetical protein
VNSWPEGLKIVTINGLEMADTRLTKIGIFRAIQICLSVIFTPAKLLDAEKADEAARKRLPERLEAPKRTVLVQRAFWKSLAVVSFALFFGAILGKLLSNVLGRPGATTITVLQTVGASVLLWATLFVRGWDIQTVGGVTLTERANRWIFQFLYCLGTVILATTLFW